jgi:hypothetical protein
MKKMFLLLMTVVLAVMPMMADNDRMLTKEELPEKARMFLDRHFDQ